VERADQRDDAGAAGEGRAAFAAVVAELDYPMVAVTAAGSDGPAGCLVGFWTQCSIEPPRLLVCVSQANHTHAVAMAADWLGVHFLGRDEHGLAATLGGVTADDVDKFAGLPWTAGPMGVPVLTGCARWVAGPVVTRADLGDHAGLVVAPTAGSCGPWPGALRYSDVRDIRPGHPVDA
jgi:flavin reductase (DIM6/NTAB) family NADH-FMN oxidoreductase RutF